MKYAPDRSAESKFAFLKKARSRFIPDITTSWKLASGKETPASCAPANVSPSKLKIIMPSLFLIFIALTYSAGIGRSRASQGAEVQRAPRPAPALLHIATPRHHCDSVILCHPCSACQKRVRQL